MFFEVQNSRLSFLSTEWTFVVSLSFAFVIAWRDVEIYLWIAGLPCDQFLANVLFAFICIVLDSPQLWRIAFFVDYSWWPHLLKFNTSDVERLWIFYFSVQFYPVRRISSGGRWAHHDLPVYFRTTLLNHQLEPIHDWIMGCRFLWVGSHGLLTGDQMWLISQLFFIFFQLVVADLSLQNWLLCFIPPHPVAVLQVHLELLIRLRYQVLFYRTYLGVWECIFQADKDLRQLLLVARLYPLLLCFFRTPSSLPNPCKKLEFNNFFFTFSDVVWPLALKALVDERRDLLVICNNKYGLSFVQPDCLSAVVIKVVNLLLNQPLHSG